jgi:hypothetical protein
MLIPKNKILLNGYYGLCWKNIDQNEIPDVSRFNVIMNGPLRTCWISKY